MSIAIGDRVRVRPNATIDVELLPSTTGVVTAIGAADEDGIERIIVELDGGGFAVGTPASEWEPGA